MERAYSIWTSEFRGPSPIGVPVIIMGPCNSVCHDFKSEVQIGYACSIPEREEQEQENY